MVSNADSSRTSMHYERYYYLNEIYERNVDCAAKLKKMRI